MPGLKPRLTQELEALITRRGWDPVKNYGSAEGKREGRLKQDGANTQIPASDSDTTSIRLSVQPKTVSETAEEPLGDTLSNIPARDRDPEVDPVVAKITQQTLQAAGGPQVSKEVRAVATLGAWAGASLVTSLRVHGAVEIERDRFLQHGLAVATSKKDASMAQQRQSFGPGVKPGAGEKSSWSLGIWA